MKNIVGYRVREIRLSQKPPLTQDELAVRLQLDGWRIQRGTLAKIESNIRQVTDIEVMRLAKASSVSPEQLPSGVMFDKLVKTQR